MLDGHLSYHKQLDGPFYVSEITEGADMLADISNM